MPDTIVDTLLFTDLVGSTELSQRLGEDAAGDVRRTHLHALRDGIMAVFGSPSDAIACAVVMQQAVERDNRRSATPLGLRVGVHVGEVSREENDYFGTAVVVAERLCKQADGGQIIASDVARARRLARRPRLPRLRSLNLKGISGPVHAFEVAWEPAFARGADVLPLRRPRSRIGPARVSTPTSRSSRTTCWRRRRRPRWTGPCPTRCARPSALCR